MMPLAMKLTRKSHAVDWTNLTSVYHELPDTAFSCWDFSDHHIHEKQHAHPFDKMFRRCTHVTLLHDAKFDGWTLQTPVWLKSRDEIHGKVIRKVAPPHPKKLDLEMEATYN